MWMGCLKQNTTKQSKFYDITAPTERWWLFSLRAILHRRSPVGIENLPGEQEYASCICTMLPVRIYHHWYRSSNIANVILTFQEDKCLLTFFSGRKEWRLPWVILLYQQNRPEVSHLFILLSFFWLLVRLLLTGASIVILWLLEWDNLGHKVQLLINKPTNQPGSYTRLRYSYSSYYISLVSPPAFLVDFCGTRQAITIWFSLEKGQDFFLY